MAFKIPNLASPIINKITGTIVPPWNNFFQQFTTNASAVISISVGTSPFSITQNDFGHFLISSGTVSAIQLIRGKTTLTLSTTLPLLVPISLGDTLKVTYSVKPTIEFVPLFS